jgi:hypothetical protein
MQRIFALAAVFAAFCFSSQAEQWDKDVGKPAAKLVAAGWVGTPLSLEAVKGNTVVLAFWNADVAC